MAVPKQAESVALLLCSVWLLALPAGAANAPALGTEDIHLSADLLDSDARNDEHVMTGNVRITQGAMSMQADQATVNGLQSENSRWQFERNVHIRTAEADLKSNSADAVFAAGRIAEATVHGTPAIFEQLNAETADKNVHGRAGTIEYDFAKGLVKMTQDVWFSYGGNEFRGDTVIYNLNDERVMVNPGGGGNNAGGRVNITIKPGTPIKLPGSQTPGDKGGSTE
ncbi:MAG TPA: LptA/OstA family protein [Povalibacter sp.]|uniref:LptA/OstA family protein n=1 Tax=Povalibacter sp. TaxID=1962978 RepID=UPI002C3E41BD|nr:LptA/OstA family protein [Povalibacter sp.]HMN45338.1 LptA/OstA family protein [Povalibacter sp.]